MKTTRQMLGMAHHLAFNCENHFGRNKSELLLKYNLAQKQCRHTVNSDRLITTADLMAAV